VIIDVAVPHRDVLTVAATKQNNECGARPTWKATALMELAVALQRAGDQFLHDLVGASVDLSGCGRPRTLGNRVSRL